MSMILRELLGFIDDRTAELSRLRAEVARLRTEREDMAGQLRFAIEQSNRETRNAGRLRAELLARTTVRPQRLDYCGGGHGETTAVLPSRVPRTRRPVRDDDTVRTRTGPHA
jgi:hypothetical protein